MLAVQETPEMYEVELAGHQVYGPVRYNPLERGLGTLGTATTHHKYPRY